MINPHAFAILTSFSKVPILEVKKMGFSEKVSVDHQHVHTDLHLRSFVYQFQHPVNQKDFEDFLRSLPDTIYRIKGYVKFSETSYPFLFQYSYGMPLYMKEYMNMPLNLVFIGEQINWNHNHETTERTRRKVSQFISYLRYE